MPAPIQITAADDARDRVEIRVDDSVDFDLAMKRTSTTLTFDGAAVVDLYVELRRYLGELGGAGPTREQAERAMARLCDREG